MTIDFDKPVRTLAFGANDEVAPVEILRAGLPLPHQAAVGLAFVKDFEGRKGLTPIVVTFDEKGYSADTGFQLENYVPEEGAFTPRTLRVNTPGITFRTKSGAEARFLSANGVDLDWEIIHSQDRSGFTQAGYITTDDKGRVVEPRPKNVSDLDIQEVHPTTTRYVRVYDKAKTAKNPTQLANAYEFGSLEEARSNLQGVRGIGILQYREGDFEPCLKG